MKFFCTLLLCLSCLLTTVQAQNDTLLYEGFEYFSDDDFLKFANGDDTLWVSFDEDGLQPYTFDPVEERWYITEAIRNPFDSIANDTNYTTISLSYMDGFAVGNRNWLITPAIKVSDASAVLHWKSSTFQLPRYMDGYSVLVSTGSNDVLLNPFTDTLFRAASMTEITGNQNSLDPSNFAFSPGYIHGDYLNTWSDTTKWDYILYNDETLAFGLLEPHSISLAAYAGKTIYVAFLHDSDDDFYLELDDILVRGNTVGTHDLPLSISNVQTYPNPATHLINLTFTLESAVEQAEVSISTTDGKQLLTSQLGARGAGQYTEQFPVHMLPKGAYQIHLRTEAGVVSKAFVKK